MAIHLTTTVRQAVMAMSFNHEFRGYRSELSQMFGITEGWWLSQPRVTTKSGWIILGAANTEGERVQLQIMTSLMAVRIAAVVLGEGCL